LEEHRSHMADHTIPITSSATIAEVSHPLQKVAEQNNRMSDDHPVLSTSGYFPAGQSTLSFAFKAPSSGTNTVQIDSKSPKPIRFSLTPPKGTSWIESQTIMLENHLLRIMS